MQAAGKVPIDVKEIRCDLLTLTAHKMHGPQGAGALYVRKGTMLQPMFYGGRHERSRRAGTENLAGIVGLGKAAEIARQGFSDGSVERMAALRDRLERRLSRPSTRSASTVRARPACPTRPTLSSTASKAKPW